MAKTKKFKPVTHLIFDLDGTILDTEGVYKDTIRKIANKFGKIYTPEIDAKVAGTIQKDTSRICVTEMKLPMTPETFSKEFRKVAYAIFKEGVTFISGARKLIDHLSKNKIPMSVATSSSIESYEIKTANHKEFFKVFSHVVCGGSDKDVKNGKPAPDIFLVAARRFPDKPCTPKCLVIEDAPNGVKGALNAGMQVVMIPDENIPMELCKEATVVVSSLDEVPLEKFNLPPMK